MTQQLFRHWSSSPSVAEDACIDMLNMPAKLPPRLCQLIVTGSNWHLLGALPMYHAGCIHLKGVTLRLRFRPLTSDVRTGPGKLHGRSWFSWCPNPTRLVAGSGPKGPQMCPSALLPVSCPTERCAGATNTFTLVRACHGSPAPALSQVAATK